MFHKEQKPSWCSSLSVIRCMMVKMGQLRSLAPTRVHPCRVCPSPALPTICGLNSSRTRRGRQQGSGSHTRVSVSFPWSRVTLKLDQMVNLATLLEPGIPSSRIKNNILIDPEPSSLRLFLSGYPFNTAQLFCSVPTVLSLYVLCEPICLIFSFALHSCISN